MWNVSLFLRPALWRWQTTSAGPTTMSHVLTSRRENSTLLYAWEQVHGVHAENHMGRSPWIMFSWWIFFMFGWKRYWLWRQGADELVAEFCQRSNTQAHYLNSFQMKPCTSLSHKTNIIYTHADFCTCILLPTRSTYIWFIPSGFSKCIKSCFQAKIRCKTCRQVSKGIIMQVWPICS